MTLGAVLGRTPPELLVDGRIAATDAADATAVEDAAAMADAAAEDDVDGRRLPAEALAVRGRLAEVTIVERIRNGGGAAEGEQGLAEDEIDNSSDLSSRGFSIECGICKQVLSAASNRSSMPDLATCDRIWSSLPDFAVRR